MSDQHDHSQHSHEHGHDHGLVRPAVPASAPVTPEPLPPDEAGSQALSEALKSSFFIVKVLMFILVGLFLFSGFFKVEPGKKAIILRFGKPQQRSNAELLGPGLHWSFPPPIDEVKKIPYAQFQTVDSTVGWYYTTKEKEELGREDPPGVGLNPSVDGYAITGDGNIIHTRAKLLYHIEDPIRYEFEFTNAPLAVQNALDNALIYAAARFKVDDVISREIVRFQDAVRARVSELAQQQNLGIVIEQCQVQSIPPRNLKAAFDGVLTALSTRDKLRNEALTYENKALANASAEAANLTNTANAERVMLVNAVDSEAKTFTELLPQYRAYPTLLPNVLLSQTIAKVLTNVQDKMYIPDRADGQKTEVRLQLSREPAGTPPANAQP